MLLFFLVIYINIYIYKNSISQYAERFESDCVCTRVWREGEDLGEKGDYNPVLDIFLRRGDSNTHKISMHPASILAQHRRANSGGGLVLV